MRISNLFTSKNKQAPEQFTRTQALSCIPVKTAGITWHEGENGDVLIEYPLPLKPFFLSIAKRFNKGEAQQLTKKLQLDETGSMVWMLMDGTNSVKTIIKEVAQQTGLTLQEAELSVTTFLRELGRRGLIILQ